MTSSSLNLKHLADKLRGRMKPHPIMVATIATLRHRAREMRFVRVNISSVSRKKLWRNDVFYSPWNLNKIIPSIFTFNNDPSMPSFLVPVPGTPFHNVS